MRPISSQELRSSSGPYQVKTSKWAYTCGVAERTGIFGSKSGRLTSPRRKRLKDRATSNTAADARSAQPAGIPLAIGPAGICRSNPQGNHFGTFSTAPILDCRCTFDLNGVRHWAASMAPLGILGSVHSVFCRFGIHDRAAYSMERGFALAKRDRYRPGGSSRFDRWHRISR